MLTFKNKAEGTYDYNTGKLVELSEGYMVTFHQNEPGENGHYKSHYGRYTEEEYDRLTNEFLNTYGAKAFIGVYDEEPEISFQILDFGVAVTLAKKYNQKSFWKNAEFAEWNNPDYNVKENPMRGD